MYRAGPSAGNRGDRRSDRKCEDRFVIDCEIRLPKPVNVVWRSQPFFQILWGVSDRGTSEAFIAGIGGDDEGPSSGQSSSSSRPPLVG